MSEFQLLMVLGYVYLRGFTLWLTLKGIKEGSVVELNPFMKETVKSNKLVFFNELIFLIVFSFAIFQEFAFFSKEIWVLLLIFWWANFQNDFHVYYTAKRFMNQVKDLELYDKEGDRVKLGFSKGKDTT